MTYHHEAGVVAPCACRLGEGPLWDSRSARLYWTDIEAGTLHRFTPSSQRHETFAVAGQVGGFTLQSDGSLLLFMERGAVRIWKDGVLATVIEDIPAERETRFNDVIADPLGGVFCGTMPDPLGRSRLYRLDPSGHIQLVLEDLKQANGMGFSVDRRGFYLTDTKAQEIRRYVFDDRTAAISSMQRFVQVPENEGAPDGLTVDAEGNVWSARWGGGSLVCYADDGAELRRYRLPVQNVTSAAFGGEGYDDLYITTAGGGAADSEPGAGNLLRLRLGNRGKPEFLSRVCL